LNKFGEIPGVYKQYSLSMPVTNEYLDVLIKEIPGNYSGIRVAVDTCNGAAREILPKLLRAYGCDVFQVDSLNDNGLSRHPHPIAEHLSDLSSLVKSKKCDIGFAADSDGDRLAIVDNNGNVLDEPYTTAFSFWHMLKNMHSDTKNVVVNMSTSRRIDDLVNALGGNIIKAHVGELKVAQAIKKYNACIGGEPSCAGVVYPKMGYVRDGQVAAAFALSLISHENKPISELIQSMPGNSKDYFMAQASELFLEDIQPILNEIADKYSSAGELNTLDGLRVDSNDFWFHVRRSNTEPIIRIITEATKKEKAYAILEDLKSFFSV
jgi:phosphomannomutase